MLQQNLMKFQICVTMTRKYQRRRYPCYNCSDTNQNLIFDLRRHSLFLISCTVVLSLLKNGAQRLVLNVAVPIDGVDGDVLFPRRTGLPIVEDGNDGSLRQFTTSGITPESEFVPL